MKNVVKTKRESAREDFIMQCKLQGIFVAAARAGNMTTLLYLHSLGYAPAAEALLQLAYEVTVIGHLPVLRWFKSLQVPIPNTELAILAAHQEHDEILEWIVQTGYNVESKEVRMVAKYGDSKLLEWVQANCRQAVVDVESDDDLEGLQESMKAI